MSEQSSPVTITQKRYQCRHVHADGRQCGSPALRHEEFCYHHHTTRRPKPAAGKFRNLDAYEPFELPVVEDLPSALSVASQLLSRIASNDLDCQRAGKMLYNLRLITTLIDRASRAAAKAGPVARPEPVTEYVPPVASAEPAPGQPNAALPPERPYTSQELDHFNHTVTALGYEPSGKYPRPASITDHDIQAHVNAARRLFGLSPLIPRKDETGRLISLHEGASSYPIPAPTDHGQRTTNHRQPTTPPPSLIHWSYMIPTLEWLPEGVNFLDQTKLPLQETYVLATDYGQVATVIRDMIVRGAPAIGVSAAMGMALGIDRSTATTLPALTAEVAVIARTLAETRPTAVNLFWGIDEIRNLYNTLAAASAPIAKIKAAVVARARQMYDQDIAACRRMGANGAALLPRKGTVLTHCNAGALATCGYGSALGVIRAAVERGHQIDVFADETRPFLQGARLTAWELMKDNIPTTVLCDNMAASLMRQGRIQAVIVGADRIAANGDVANKIGTYGVAILAREHHIPFYVAAPWATLDLATANGDLIPIEQRDPREVTHSNGRQMTPNGVAIENPAFDVTPAAYVTAIITERGILRAPYAGSIGAMAAAAPQPPELVSA